MGYFVRLGVDGGRSVRARTHIRAIQPATFDDGVEAEAAGTRSVVYVVDRDAPSREATGALLRRNGLSVEAYASPDSVLKGLSPAAAGCLLVYDAMPATESYALLDRLRDARSPLPVIVVIGDADIRAAVRAMRSGAVDCLEQPVSTDELLASIERALEQSQRSADEAALLAAGAEHFAGLTGRQREILEFLLDGQPNKAIAARLGISQRTVETHRAAIMRRTGAKSLTALVRMALAAK